MKLEIRQFWNTYIAIFILKTATDLPNDDIYVCELRKAKLKNVS